MRSRVITPQPGSYYPQEPPGKFVGDYDKPVTEQYLKTTHNELTRILSQIVERMGEKSLPFDSYRPQSVGGELTSSLNIPSDFAQQEVQSLVVTGPTAGFGSFNGHGSVATPAAFAVIASTSVNYSGLYTVQWSVGIETAAATTADNFQLLYQGNLQEQSENGVAIGDYAQQSITLYLTAGSLVTVRTGATAEVTGTYSATLTLEPYQGVIPFTLTLGDRNWNLALPNTGLFSFRVKPGIWLKQEDAKQLNSPVAGNWAVELTGYRSAYA